MRSWNPGGKGSREKCQPQQFSIDLCFQPVRMLASNALPVQFAGKHAHLKCEEQTLLSRHGPLNVDLNRLRRWARVRVRHGKMVPRRQKVNRPTHVLERDSELLVAD
jgi:hypothetical protein